MSSQIIYCFILFFNLAPIMNVLSVNIRINIESTHRYGLFISVGEYKISFFNYIHIDGLFIYN